MTFSVGDILDIEDKEYQVIGRIVYRNSMDGFTWDEYRMVCLKDKKEAWLSIDENYKEYSISFVVRKTNLNGFHEVDRGTEIVVSAIGDVDVDPGEQASFVEYEDQTEELIISEEIWSDGAEYSEGHYLDNTDILYDRTESVKGVRAVSAGGSGAGTKVRVIVAVLPVLFILFIAVPFLAEALFSTTIEEYVSADSKYTYLTSITGKDQQKADVYMSQTGETVDSVAKDIIKAIDGKTEYVQEDTEDNGNSVAILTENEYCIVYLSQDNEGVLVQISSRHYAYTSDNDLYHGSIRSRRYFRRFYYSNGYSSDTSKYSGSYSPYSSYSDSTISYNSSNSYNTYSGSIRQSSIFSRISSGGGLSSGK